MYITNSLEMAVGGVLGKQGFDFKVSADWPLLSLIDNNGNGKKNESTTVSKTITTNIIIMRAKPP